VERYSKIHGEPKRVNDNGEYKIDEDELEVSSVEPVE
jgi:hypothetical protein